jgi:hypothetical protein
MTVIGVSCVGWLTGGPWKGRKCIGNSLAVGPGGRTLAVGPYGVDAEALTVVEVTQSQFVPRMNAIHANNFLLHHFETAFQSNVAR